MIADLTLLTTTGARPEAWAICEKLMARQTFTGNVRWIVVDDGEEPQSISFYRDKWTVEVLRPKPFWKSGMNTQSRNLQAGLSKISRFEKLVVIEDDDWYSPAYLSEAKKWLQLSDLSGESFSKYFNVSTGMGKSLPNDRHSGLCSTVLKGRAIDLLKMVSKDNIKFIDIELWKKFHGTKRLYNTSLVVGIKGLPGRRGIGSGHNPKFGEPMDLSKWIGSDVEIYQRWIPPIEKAA